MTRSELTCIDCRRTAEPAEGYLRPEGFVCGDCYARRLEDPDYVSRLERELLGLVRAAGGSGDADQTLRVPEGRGERAARWIDSLRGLAVGDALGAGREGQPFRADAPPLEAPSSDAPAPWTDDTQTALSVVECLLEGGEIDGDRLARAFVRRFESWRGYAAGMHALVEELRGGGDWREARYAMFPDGSFGNGSAMRVAPVGAFLAEGPVGAVVEQATRSAVVTHAHPEAVAGAVAVAVAARLAARSRGAAAPEPAQVLEAAASACPHRGEVTRGIRAARELPAGAELGRAVRALGNGSRVSCPDTVPLALWIAATHMDDFRGAVERAVAAGGDTDTVAAIVGGIVASRVSAAGIPAEWLEGTEPLPISIKTPRWPRGC